MTGLRPTAAAVLAAVAVAVASGIAAQPASAEAVALTGTSENRHGSVTLYFTTDPGWLRVKLGGKVRTTSRGKLFVVQCRKGDGRYAVIAGYHVTLTLRYLTSPATVPVGTDRCRVRRDGKVIAEMRMRAT